MKPPAPAPFAPSVFERLCALRSVSPFDRLHPSDLLLLAELAQPRAYAPGEIIHGGDDRLARVLVVVGGSIHHTDGSNAGSLLGPDSLVRNTPVPQLRADPVAGARVLSLERGPFFTLLRECPAFTLGLLELGAARRQQP